MVLEKIRLKAIPEILLPKVTENYRQFTLLIFQFQAAIFQMIFF